MRFTGGTRVWLTLGLGLLIGAPLAAQRKEPLPNILVIVADDLGWRDIDASVPTPSLDLLAARGVTYRRAYSSPTCSPTRLGLLFGLHGFREQLGQFIRSCDPADVSVPLARVALPELLRARGYRTLAAGKWHLNTVALGPVHHAPILQGFHSYRAGWIDNLGKGGGNYSDWVRIDDGRLTPTTEYNTTAIRRATVNWWRRTPGPKFAYVAFHAPHGPFHEAPSSLLPPGYVIGPGERGRFESMTVALDTEIGRLLSAVDLRNTLVFFISDNGTPEGAIAPDQAPDRVKSSVFEGGINVPVIAAGWKTARNRTCDALIGTTDFFATILDVLGEPVPAGVAIDSVSFAPTLERPFLPGRAWVFAQVFAPNGPGPHPFLRKAVITPTHKLMERDGFEELYDLVGDPGELTPLGGFGVLPLYLELRGYMDSMEAQGAP